jgi:hypothetical protein
MRSVREAFRRYSLLCDRLDSAFVKTDSHSYCNEMLFHKFLYQTREKKQMNRLITYPPLPCAIYVSVDAYGNYLWS